jgi:hypothetical protein
MACVGLLHQVRNVLVVDVNGKVSIGPEWGEQVWLLE